MSALREIIVPREDSGRSLWVVDVVLFLLRKVYGRCLEKLFDPVASRL